MIEPPRKLILASSSPRRSDLLTEHGYDFEIQFPDEGTESGICSGETPPEFVARLAYQKAENVAKKIEEGIVLGCDTVAELHGQILGKPRDYEHALEMLALLNGKKHRVISGICLYRRPENRVQTCVDITTLQMRELSTAEIEEYLDTDLWIGKAGGFGLQDGIDWVEIVEGSESNVVGLPMERLRQMLAESV